MRSLEEEEVKPELKWDIKRIIIGIVILASLLGIGFLMFLPKNNQSLDQSTLGVSSKNPENVPPLPSKENIEKVIDDARSSLSQITYDNVTSSQAAIQKIISDLQLLQEKKEPVQVICDLLCKK